MKKLTLNIVCLTCVLCNCIAQTASLRIKDNAQQNKNEIIQPDSMREREVPNYRVTHVENTHRLRWTGKTFIGKHKDKANTWLIKAVIKGMDAKWLRHSLLVTAKDVWVLKDSVQKDFITIVALKSAEKGWDISAFKREYFLIAESKAPLHAVPYFINGSVYVICLIPSSRIVGDEVQPIIDRNALYEDMLKPLLNEPFL